MFHLKNRLRHKFNAKANIGEDNANRTQAVLFFDAGVCRAITAMAIASEGVQNKKKKTNDK
jgi:hypothetical protein